MPDWAVSINDAMFRFVTRGAMREQVQLFLPLGFVVGLFLAFWSSRLIARESRGTRRLTWPAGAAIVAATAVLFPLLIVAAMQWRCQWLTEGGSIDWAQWRMPYYFVLIGLLIVATAIDFDQYLIPDDITWTGTLIGLVWATAFGHMHLIPAWIDWNAWHPITGPYIPEWIKDHPHWHGLVFSLAGLLAGAGVTWLARFVSQRVLGVEALGFGDVTLMGMIGSFLGWQPILFVFLLAPICGLLIGMTLKLVHSRRAVPYGPYLSGAALLVLLTWRWLWIPTRELFGHWPTLLALGGSSVVTLVALLGLVRLFRAIPVTRRVVRPSVDEGPSVVASEVDESSPERLQQTEHPSDTNCESPPESATPADAPRQSDDAT